MVIYAKQVLTTMECEVKNGTTCHISWMY